MNTRSEVGSGRRSASIQSSLRSSISGHFHCPNSQCATIPTSELRSKLVVDDACRMPHDFAAAVSINSSCFGLGDQYMVVEDFKLRLE